jgi:hypothetical protein
MLGEAQMVDRAGQLVQQHVAVPLWGLALEVSGWVGDMVNSIAQQLCTWEAMLLKG